MLGVGWGSAASASDDGRCAWCRNVRTLGMAPGGVFGLEIVGEGVEMKMTMKRRDSSQWRRLPGCDWRVAGRGTADVVPAKEWGRLPVEEHQSCCPQCCLFTPQIHPTQRKYTISNPTHHNLTNDVIIYRRMQRCDNLFHNDHARKKNATKRHTQK